MTASNIETLSDRDARLFAADCAERVLPLFEAKCPDDPRPREAIAAARAFACGEIDADALRVACKAAIHAADAASGGPAYDASASGGATYAAASAAAATASNVAARDAVDAATYGATRAANAAAAKWDGEADRAFATYTLERAWQAERLKHYTARNETKSPMPDSKNPTSSADEPSISLDMLSVEIRNIPPGTPWRAQLIPSQLLFRAVRLRMSVTDAADCAVSGALHVTRMCGVETLRLTDFPSDIYAARRGEPISLPLVSRAAPLEFWGESRYATKTVDLMIVLFGDHLR